MRRSKPASATSFSVAHRTYEVAPKAGDQWQSRKRRRADGFRFEAYQRLARRLADIFMVGEEDTFYEGPNHGHVVDRNASSTKPAKFVVFMIKGKVTLITQDWTRHAP